MSTGLNLPPIVSHSMLSTIDDYVICDVRWYLDSRSGRDAYLVGHLPGAVFVDLEEHLTSEPSPGAGRHPLPTESDFAASMGSLGIGPEDPVIAYDDAGGMAAGRLVWMLRILGRPAALLDGGIDAWSGPLEMKATTRPPKEVPAVPWPADALVTMSEVAEMISSKGGILLDARSAERYRGEVEPMDPRAGHVPGAVNAPYVKNLAADGPEAGRFLSPAELENRYRSLGVNDARTAVVYCGSGVSACHDLLAMEYAGLGRGRLFVGSWSQWSHTDRPLATGIEQV